LYYPIQWARADEASRPALLSNKIYTLWLRLGLGIHIWLESLATAPNREVLHIDRVWEGVGVLSIPQGSNKHTRCPLWLSCCAYGRRQFTQRRWTERGRSLGKGIMKQRPAEHRDITTTSKSLLQHSVAGTECVTPLKKFLPSVRLKFLVSSLFLCEGRCVLYDFQHKYNGRAGPWPSITGWGRCQGCQCIDYIRKIRPTIPPDDKRGGNPSKCTVPTKGTPIEGGGGDYEQDGRRCLEPLIVWDLRIPLLPSCTVSFFILIIFRLLTYYYR